jgi:broad specificity phosphatase PhoE
MKTLEIRRHSLRKDGGGSQLSQKGVDEARALGTTLGPFARVVTSVIPRARETAIAMGFAVDYEIVTLPIDEDLFAEIGQANWWNEAHPFSVMAQTVAAKGATYRYAHTLLAVWRDMLTALPDESAALFIGHSGELELALVACFPHADHTGWGGTFSPLEGARLKFGGEPERFLNLELLRNKRG